MPQGNVPQFSGHNYTTSETAIKYRTLNGGNPLAHDDVDANYEILRKAVNGLVADIGLANSTSSSGIASIQSSLTSLQGPYNTTKNQVDNLLDGSNYGAFTWQSGFFDPSDPNNDLNNPDYRYILTPNVNIEPALMASPLYEGLTTTVFDLVSATTSPTGVSIGDNGASVGDVVNNVPAIDLTYPAGPRIRGGAQGVRIVTNNQDSNGNYIDSTSSNAGLSCSRVTVRGGNGPSNSPASPNQSTSIYHDSDGLQIHPISNNSSNPERVLIRGDLKVEGKIITDSDLVVDGDLEDSSGNAVGGGGPWSSWLDVNVPEGKKHFGGGGSGVFDINFHSYFPGASEVVVQAHVGEAYIRYWNVYTCSWVVFASAPDNTGATGGCAIKLAPGFYDTVHGGSSDINPGGSLQVIPAGTVKFHAGMAAGDENTADVVWFRIRYWR